VVPFSALGDVCSVSFIYILYIKMHFTEYKGWTSAPSYNNIQPLLIFDENHVHWALTGCQTNKGTTGSEVWAELDMPRRARTWYCRGVSSGLKVFTVS
jgi:hypothetical protein